MPVLTPVPFDELEPSLMVACRTRQGLQVVHRLMQRQGADAWQVQGLNNLREDAEQLTRLNYLGVVYASLAHKDPDEASAEPDSDDSNVAP